MASRVERATADLVRRVRRGRPDPLTSLVLTTPVFLLYHLGILWTDRRNGVDWVTELTLRLLHSSVRGYVLVTLGFALALSIAAFALRGSGVLRPAALLPIAVESALWAVMMLVGVGWATAHVVHSLAAASGLGLDPFERLVMAAGAGFHEELTFRVVLLSGGARLLQRAFGAARARAWLLCALASSALFALAHHVGPSGEGLTLAALCFRTLAGLFLALVYGARGFAAAVYTHAFYDMLVFFVLG